MRIGIFGGSFNPPHLAHLIIAELLRDAFLLDRILWVPSAQPPHKDPTDVVSAMHRLIMVRLAVAGNPAFEASDLELERNGPSYTLDTVLELKRRHPDDDLFLIVGGDSLAEFHTWHEPEQLVREIQLIVYDRSGSPPPTLKLSPDRILRAAVPMLDLSSTDIRRRIAAGLTVRYLVPDSVAKYVQEHDLYRA